MMGDSDDKRDLTTGTGRFAASYDPREIVPASMLSRRRFVSGLGASLSALGAAACSRTPPEQIVPYVTRPPELVPGLPGYYATSSARSGYAFGLLATSYEGRPTKLDGHPSHPASLGASTAEEQAAIYSLYDRDRARPLRHGEDPASWQALAALLAPGANAPFAANQGQGLYVWFEATSSPLLAREWDRVRERYPRARAYYGTSLDVPARWQATQRLYGAALDSNPDLSRARVVLALDSDFLNQEPNSVRWARDFSRARGPLTPADDRNRLYVIECAVSPTGIAADHRLALKPSEIPVFAAALFVALADASGDPRALELAARSRAAYASYPHQRFAAACARDLWQHRDASAIFVGERLPVEAHLIGLALQELLSAGRENALVRFVDPALSDAGSEAWSARSLLRALAASEVDTLLIIGENPAYALPPDSGYHEHFRKARERVHLSLYENETSETTTWFVPRTHFLEQWGDGRAWDGTLTLRQPLIQPLFGGKGEIELLRALLGDLRVAPNQALRESWSERLASTAGARDFATVLAHGFLEGSATPARRVTAEWAEVGKALDAVAATRGRGASREGLELNVVPDPRFGIADLANIAELQELPAPSNKLVWDNAALLSRETAERLGVADGDVVVLRSGPAELEIPALIEPGVADDSVTVWLGYGRRGALSVARGVGSDVAPLRSTVRPWAVPGVRLSKAGRSHPLVTTQKWHSQEDREIARRVTLPEWQQHPQVGERVLPPTIMPRRLSGEPQWGMAIDLDRCTGCSACVLACQVENNVPVVGKAQVGLGREMQWLRIDRYYDSRRGKLAIDLQPMLCQHCEKAPCEYVCPVNATVHSPDGLNEMVYNRCVGTRFCSNNCPYKVRRFNFFNYNQNPPETAQMAKNPDVTVRGRGVMEKCTYCVQRIRRAQINAHIEHRAIGIEEVHSACQQACPTGAIVFGLVSAKDSQVSRLQQSPRAYSVLQELNTFPRTRYLARIDNHNPELES